MSGKNTHKRLLCSVCRNRRSGDGHCWLVSTLLQTRLPQGTLHCFCMRHLVRDWTFYGYWGNTSTCFSLVPSQEICALYAFLSRSSELLLILVFLWFKATNFRGMVPDCRLAAPTDFIRGILAGKLDFIRLRFFSVSNKRGAVINDYL